MGNYVTANDLDRYLSQTALRQLTDDANTGAPDQAVIDEAITGAEAEVDGYLRGLYTVPLTTPPSLVVDVAIRLTVYRLYERRQRITEEMAAIGSWARDALGKIADGTITLDETGSTDASDRTMSLTTQERLHTRTTWSGW